MIGQKGTESNDHTITRVIIDRPRKVITHSKARSLGRCGKPWGETLLCALAIPNDRSLIAAEGTSDHGSHAMPQEWSLIACKMSPHTAKRDPWADVVSPGGKLCCVWYGVETSDDHGPFVMPKERPLIIRRKAKKRAIIDHMPCHKRDH